MNARANLAAHCSRIASAAHAARRVVALVVVASTTGCVARPMTPPITAGVSASAGTLQEDEVAVAVNAGLHGRVFGPNVGAVDGRVRIGLTDGVELSLNGGAYVVGGSHDGDDDVHRGIYTGRAGLKVELHRNVALIAGLGGGVSPTVGLFAGADMGFVFAYENRFFVPFLALKGFYSVPINPAAIDLGDGAARPAQTGGGTLEAGMRVPAGRDRRFNLVLSGMVTVLYDGRGGLIASSNTLWLTGFMTGFEARFGGEPSAAVAHPASGDAARTGGP